MTLPIAVQLYTVRDALAQDFEGVIRKIADIGFAGVEPAGFPGTTPEAAAKLFKELGLQVPSAHSGPPIGDNKNEVLDTMAAIGVKYLVVPYFPPDAFKKMDDIKAICDKLNEADAVARENGLTLAYHNHWWEYQPLNGQYVYHIMLENLAPTIQFELDTYWVKAGGPEPEAVLSELGARVPLVHVKDGPANTTDAMTAAGDGVLDWHKIIPAAKSAEWLVVELDRCDTDMMQAVEKSYQYLTKEGFGHGRKS